MPLEGFKIPGSFLKKRADQEYSENSESGLTAQFPATRRTDFSSGRLFGNLTRGGPTSVQNPLRGEGARPPFHKAKDRRFVDHLQEPPFALKSERSSESQNQSASRFKLIRNVERSSRSQADVDKVPFASKPQEERLRSTSIFRKRSSSSLAASAAAVKRATKLVRAKRSNSREELTDSKEHTYVAKTSDSSRNSSVNVVQLSPSPKFRAASYAAESLTATREQAVILRSLLALVGRHCPTEFDKYVLLEERDKLLSKLRDEENKKNNGERQIVKGTCLAMCPEKERYVRVVQKRISQYECNPDGTLNPNRMVKEYSRSAADQDNPLPHELRSKELLENSIGYLLKHVLDCIPESEDDLAMWYDFLWSRTRAIRKEITQLMLTDATAVALIERCARLHILCAYKLCRLGLEKFDQNMNTENLAKCLQSLRHLYEDLAVQGIEFETEAEFRGYDVMLHLYDSNILRQVLSYRKEVRDSQPVRLALQLSGALQNKNYVKFFRLLKGEATFLQCCICHRYFNTVQSQALLTMMTAYGRNSVFPLDKMWHVLAWDEREDALRSLALYGVHQNDMDCDQIVLNRDHFIQDATPCLRPFRWIDVKNSASWSQVAHGPTLFSFSSISIVPDSFDKNGVYNKDEVLSVIFESYSLQAEAQQAMMDHHHPSSEPLSRSRDGRETHNWVKSKVENVVNEVVDEQSFSICRIANIEEVALSISNDIIDDVSNRFIFLNHANFHFRNLIMDIILEERKDSERQQANLKLERVKEAKEKLVQDLVELVIDSTCNQGLRKVIKEEMKDAFLQHIDNATQFIIEELWRSKLIHLVDRETKNIVKKTLKSDLEEVQVGLQRFRERMELMWLRQFWDAWRLRVVENRRKRQQRLKDWEHFQGVWDCKMFVPSKYAYSGCSNKQKSTETSPSSGLVSGHDIRTALRVIRLKKQRSDRIVRTAFERWRIYTQRRQYARSLMKVMLHRPKPLDHRIYLDDTLFDESETKRRKIEPSHHRSSESFHNISGPLRDSSNYTVLSAENSLSYEDITRFESSKVSYSFNYINERPSSIHPTPFRPPSPSLNEYNASSDIFSSLSSGEKSQFSESNITFGKDINSDDRHESSVNLGLESSDVAPSLKDEDLLNEASSLREKMIKFSNDLNAVISRRKEIDAECSRLAKFQSL